MSRYIYKERVIGRGVGLTKNKPELYTVPYASLTNINCITPIGLAL